MAKPKTIEKFKYKGNALIPMRALKILVEAAGWEWIKLDNGLIFARPKGTLTGAFKLTKFANLGN